MSSEISKLSHHPNLPQIGSVKDAATLAYLRSLNIAISNFHQKIAILIDEMCTHGTTAERPDPTGGRRFYFDETTEILYYDNGSWQTIGSGGGGEANTGSNVGADGVGVFDAKVSLDLQFRHIAPASNKITVVLNGNDIDIDIDEANLTAILFKALLDAKGDLIGATADNTPARLGVGTNGQSLIATSGEATGLLWRDLVEADVTDLHEHGNKTQLDLVSDGDHDVSDGSDHADVVSNSADRHAHGNMAEIDLVTVGDHDVIVSGNPHDVTKSDVSLGNVLNILHKIDATVAPTVNDDSDDGYSNGSTWIDATHDKAYTCLDDTVGAAIWREIGGGGSFDIIDTAGDLIYGTADDVVDRLAIGADRNLFLSPTGGLPTWRTFTEALNHGIYYAADFGTLQIAINTAGDAGGGCVILQAGVTYHEAILMPQDNVSIWSPTKSAIIDGGEIGHAVVISGANCGLFGLTLKTTSGAGNSYNCVTIAAAAFQCTIEGITIAESDHMGISISSESALIHRAVIHPCDFVAINMSTVSAVVNIIWCHIYDVETGSTHPLITKGSGNKIIGNSIGSGTVGSIKLDGNSVINTVGLNNCTGSILDSGTSNAIIHNIIQGV